MLEIDTHNHSRLLYLASQLSYQEAEQYRRELQAAYADYLASVAAYEIVARTVEQKLNIK